MFILGIDDSKGNSPVRKMSLNGELNVFIIY